ncbi:hypothetical protein PMAYCL1PPCAC_13743, partial [Pristionchus mayeri]
DEKYSFFYLMPHTNSSLEEMRNELTGEKLINVLSGAANDYVDLKIPKFKVETELDGIEVLSKLGVKTLFSDGADLSKISTTPLKVSKIAHHALIQVNEEGTEAGAATKVEGMNKMFITQMKIDRPFLFGILKGEDILFLGQFA